MEINSIILSAGKGTRMKVDKPKVIQKVLGYEMINCVLNSLTKAGINNNTLVVGYKKDDVLNVIDDYDYRYVEQKEQLGTGHAILVCKEMLENNKGITIVTCGDTPLIRPETFKQLIKKHKQSNSTMTILTSEIEDPTGYGRIIRDDVDMVKAIVEEKDTTKSQKNINEINSGIYCFDNRKLFKFIEKISNKNNQNEYYLTDLVEIFNNNNEVVSSFVVEDENEIIGINDLAALSTANKILQRRINKEHQINGVNIIDGETTYIGPKVKIGVGTIVEPNNVITGNSVIGTGNLLKISNEITDTIIGNDTVVGPMAHTRQNTRIGNDCRIGNFVELKNTKIGNNTNAAHLTYLGDCEVGNNVNIGCGVITANYDGVNKHETKIGNNSFIGSNVTLIAPINIKEGVLIAAGSTISIEEIEENKLVIARAKEVIKEKR